MSMQRANLFVDESPHCDDLMKVHIQTSYLIEL